MATQTKLVTYDDYRNLPEDGKRYEIIGGKLFMAPAPGTEHQNILGNLHYLFRQFLDQSPQGKVFMAPIDVVLSMTDVVQPDLVFISKERQHIITQKNIVEAPDLAVEILSDSTEVIDRNQKKKLYEKYGVKEYWLVHPQQKQIEQHVLTDEQFSPQGKIGASGKITSEVISDFSLSSDEVFLD